MKPKTAAEHHQVAYELDCVAGHYLQIEHHYQRAIELDPTNPRYHADWVCYLLTRARPGATADAWAAAQKACPHAYEVLHFPVARLALHFVQLPFADDVLSSVPAERRVGDFAVLWDTLQMFWLADGDQSVQISDELYQRGTTLPPIFPDPLRYIRKWIEEARAQNSG